MQGNYQEINSFVNKYLKYNGNTITQSLKNTLEVTYNKCMDPICIKASFIKRNKRRFEYHVPGWAD